MSVYKESSMGVLFPLKLRLINPVFTNDLFIHSIAQSLKTILCPNMSKCAVYIAKLYERPR